MMDVTEKKVFARQMYTNDSEVGRMKLQSVKENLYEATTKAVLYSIEMYTKKDLAEWARTGLLRKLDKANNDLRRERGELELGHIGMFDITNGCCVINNFVRKDALELSCRELEAKINQQNSRIAEFTKKEEILQKRKQELEMPDDGHEEVCGDDEEDSDILKDLETGEADDDNYDEADDDGDYHDDEDDDYEDDDDEDDDYEDDDDNEDDEDDDYEDDEDDDDNEDDDDAEYEDDDEDEDIEDEKPPTELELFESRVLSIKNLEGISDLEEELSDERKETEAFVEKLKKLTKKGGNLLSKQSDSEKNSLENLRTLRNTVFAHKTEDEQEISLIGDWVPEAGPLYLWAAEILKYIKTIGERYEIYSLFDDFYASKEGKGKFDGCKVYVQKQIRELYINRQGVVFEFAGNLYDKEDEEFNFKKLVENMAVSWNTGIRYLTVVTNEDIPEMNVFFRECLSGTNKYVDSYLLDRNDLRDDCKRGAKDADYIYFRLLYHLNPSMEKLYWRGRTYSRKEFAGQVIYKLIKVKNQYQFDARIKDPGRYMGGIDIRKWSEWHLLSGVYFACIDDPAGQSKAREMEEAVVEFCGHDGGRGWRPLYRKAIRALTELYFYMGEDYIFSYTRGSGQTIHWSSLGEACRYMENHRNFGSYEELFGFVEELSRSDYFKIWRNELKKKDRDEGGGVKQGWA